MKQTLRIFVLLAVAVLTAGQVWALRGNPVTFVYASEHGTADAAVSNGQVTITISPSDGWRCIDGDVTAVATAVNSGVAESRRAEGGQGNVSIDLGETIDVACTKTNVFTLTLPEDENKNVRVTVAFRERLTFTPTVSITDWTFCGYDATTNAPTVSGNESGGAVTYTYADTQDGTYTTNVPTAAGTHYVKATIAATADYNAAEAVKSFTIAAKETTSVSYINAEGVLCDGVGDHPAKKTAYILDGTETSLEVDGSETWYVCNTNLTYTKGLFLNGDIHLVLADDVTMNINPEDDDFSIYSEFAMTIYGQTKGTGVLNTTRTIAFMGDITINGGNVNSGGTIGGDLSGCIVTVGDFIVNGGSVTTNPEIPLGILVSGNVIVNGGTVTAESTASESAGIFARGITINGGTVSTQGSFVGILITEMGSSRAYMDVCESRAMNIPSANEPSYGVTINGGKVTAIGGEDNEETEDIEGGGIVSVNDITLGWTNADDFILVSSYISQLGKVKVAEGKSLMDENGNIYSGEQDEEGLSAIAGKKLTSDQVEKFTFAEGQTWMTWCGSKGYTLPEGLEAYTISGLSEDGKSVMLAPATAIAADTPLLLKGTAGTTYTALWASTGSATGLVSSTVDNVLTFYGNPTDEVITTGNYCVLGKSYVLYKGTFLLVDTDSGIPANKCLLTLSGSNAARQLNISLGETGLSPCPIPADAPTRSLSPEGKGSSCALYDLQGRKIDGQPTKHGIYLYNGKKVIK